MPMIRGLFDLITDPSQLSSANEGIGQSNYQQITATRNVGINAFGSNGIIQFRFTSGGTSWWVPSMSYFRLRITLTQVRAIGAAALPPLCKGDMAPGPGFVANLFKTIEVQLNGQNIDRVGERLAQIDALKTRQCRSKSWIDSVGDSTNFWQYDHNQRKQQICADGYVADEKTWDVVYQEPPLTSLQAGFTAGTTIQLVIDTNVVTFSADDILDGRMALRSGDIIFHAPSGAKLRVVTVTSATDCVVEILNRAHTLAIAAGQPFQIQKLSGVSRNDAVGKNSFEVIWQPPLGFFDHAQGIPPGGTWTIEFDPENVTQFKIGPIESTLGPLRPQPTPINIVNNLAGDFDLSVDQMYFYAYNVEQERFENGAYYLDLMTIRCQQDSMATNSTSLVTKNFDVSAKTTALTLAFQDQESGTSTLFSRSKFKLRNGVLAAGGGVGASRGQDMLLKRFWIQYNNITKPNPDFDGKYVIQQGNNTLTQFNEMTQRYVDSMLQNGSYITEGGSETLTEWIERGPFYHFQWPKDATSNATRVNVSFEFSQAFTPADSSHRVLLFQHARNAIHIVHENGEVKSITKETQ